jgi:glycerol-3-phosphate acyltransferase PlsY
MAQKTLVDLAGAILVVTPGLLTLVLGVALGFVPLTAAMLILLIIIATLLSSIYLSKPLTGLLSLNHVSVKTFHIMYGLFVLFLGALYGSYTVMISMLACLLSYGLYEYLHWYRNRDVPFITEALKLLGSPEDVEERPFLSPVYASLGIFFTSAFFTPQIANAAISVLALGDGFAALAGRIAGRNPLPVNGRKTIEGSLTGFFIGAVGCQLFLPIKLALIGSFAGMLIEALPLPLNDNLTVPIFSAICMTLALGLAGL